MDAGVKWTPYLEKMKGLVDSLQPAALTEWKGQSLAPALEFVRGQSRGGFSAYRTDKLEKIGIGSFVRAGSRHFAFCSIMPGEAYDLPLFLSRLEEGPDEVILLVDIIPAVDSLVHEEYRKKYIESVQPLWDRFASLPGICPEESDVIRSLTSIIYTAARVPIEKEGMRMAALAPHTEYLKSYLAFLSEAAPVTDEAKKKELATKRTALRTTLRTHFFKEMLPGPAREELGNGIIELLNAVYF
jgi:hypothetical protein